MEGWEKKPPLTLEASRGQEELSKGSSSKTLTQCLY